MTTASSLSTIYLKCLGYIFAIAFLSYYAQYPALSSQSGVEPSEHIFRHNFPFLYSHIVDRGIADADSFVELLGVFGVVLSTLVASGVVHHGLIFLALTSIYHFFIVLGASFYTFQWDVLLIEAGFLTGVCFAPWLVLRPLAWHAHQLPPLLLRLGVATTFVVEIPAAFLLLSPCLSMRKVGAWLQILLQVLIILTGSYNFFNLLTITLCLPCMVGVESHDGNEKVRSIYSRIWHVLQLALCALCLAWACRQMFSLDYTEDPADSTRQMIGLKLAMSKYDCNLLVDQEIPIVFACMLVFTMVSGLRSIIEEKSNRFSALSAFIHLLVCYLCIAITTVPLRDLSPNSPPGPSPWPHDQTTKWGIRLKSSTWRNIRLHSSSVSHGYGLFRRMTGVGQQQQINSHDDGAVVPMGWAGLPPSIVERPEIILEAQIDDSEEWRELNFRWKPGRVDLIPLQAAPHQPRFDWRMWFAALGSVQHNPWFLSFIHQILSGCPTALDLLNEPEIMAGNEKIVRVRANLYHYDFTRLDTEWARRIPDVSIVDTGLFQHPDKVWTRKFVRQYIPPLERDNQSLREFLQQRGYGNLGCVSEEERCSNVGTVAKMLCQVAVALRKMNRKLWVLPLAALLSCCIVEYQRKQSKQEKLKME